MKRRRAWLWVFGTLGAILLAFGGIVWDAHRRADAVLARHQVEARDLLQAFRARPSGRPVFDGEGVEGNAWEIYRDVLFQLGTLPPEEQDALDYALNELPADDEALDLLFVKYEPHIVKIREALNRTSVDPDVVGRGADALSALTPSIPSAKLIGGGIAHHHRMGRDAKALALAELGLGFSQDVGRRGCVIGLLIRLVNEGIMVWNLQQVLASHALSAGELEGFSRRLDRLDASRPTTEVEWDSEEIFMRGSLVDGDWESKEAKPLRRLIGWRQVWSLRVAQAQALDVLPVLFEDGRRASQLPTHERVAEVERLLERWGRERVAILHALSPSILRALQNDVKGLQARAILRVAVALAWHEVEKGAFPAALEELAPRYIPRVLRDPLSGRAFGYAAGKLWAAGPDGVDNAGAVDPINPEEPRDGYDVVWTVRRRK